MSEDDSSNEYKWPPKCTLKLYDSKGVIFLSSKDRLFELADNIMLRWPHNSRTVYLGMATESKKWDIWSDDNLIRIEQLIEYDICFDGYKVKITRESAIDCLHCIDEFRWKLVIKPC